VTGLSRAYKIDDAAGVLIFICVVQGAGDGTCKKPAAANAAGFLGVTLEAQPNQNRGVTVCKEGIVRVVAQGTIARGDRLAIGSAAGDVKSVEALIVAAPGAASVQNVIGQAEASAVAGDIFQMWIKPFVVNIAVS
jgi:hypothetical protein